MVERESAWSSLSGVSALLHEAHSVSFSFYTKEEVRRLSAVRIESSRQRDVMNRPLPGGLYDARMGPTDHYESCVTCGLDYAMCPGHFGHIELPLPAYAHLLFPLLYSLLRATCRECHHLRAPRIRLEPFAAALGLIDAGMLTDAASVLEKSHCVPGKWQMRPWAGVFRPPLPPC
jgi:DNA-directed RNA polymerase I subunit RPA1